MSIIQRPFSVAPCQTFSITIRNFFIAVCITCGWAGACWQESLSVNKLEWWAVGLVVTKGLPLLISLCVYIALDSDAGFRYVPRECDVPGALRAVRRG